MYLNATYYIISASIELFEDIQIWVNTYDTAAPIKLEVDDLKSMKERVLKMFVNKCFENTLLL